MAPPALREEIHLRLLRLIEARPEATQRELAAALGVSLGKMNYCLAALTERGWVKARNFSASRHKLGYMRLLTPAGLQAKSALAVSFLRRKVEEYDALVQEIELLRREVGAAKRDAERP